MNDASQKYQIPWIYGACVGSYGISYTIIPGETPCLNCLLETVPMGGITCDTAGIISPVVQMVVAFQTAEALKILTGNTQALRHKLVSFDLWANQHSAVNVQAVKKKNCLSCGSEPVFPHLSQQNQTKTAVLCGRDTVQIRPAQSSGRDLESLESRLSDSPLVEQVARNPYLLSFSMGRQRIVAFKDGRVLVHGTKDITAAKTLYHQYLG